MKWIFVSLLVASAPAWAARHRIAPGETLTAISQRYLGRASRWKELLRVNPRITNPDLIIAGQELLLPTVVETNAAEEVPPTADKAPEKDRLVLSYSTKDRGTGGPPIDRLHEARSWANSANSADWQRAYDSLSSLRADAQNDAEKIDIDLLRIELAQRLGAREAAVAVAKQLAEAHPELRAMPALHELLGLGQ